jgi:hypothetical protein
LTPGRIKASTESAPYCRRVPEVQTKRKGAIMFNNSTAIQVFGFARQARPGTTRPTAAQEVQIEDAASKVGAQTERRMKDEAWRRPEWWEHHNYERR